jgi:hypothetical protein
MPPMSLDLSLVNARPRRCERCGCLAPFAAPLEATAKRELHVIAVENETMQFMKRLREIAHCDLASAKAVFAHITTKRGVCNWCSKQIPIVEYVDCAQCKSFNIWWGDAA